MKIRKVRLKISLYTRFMTAITFILILLVGSIVFVIQEREVKTIFEDSKNRGILIAKNIANHNLQRLQYYDEEGTRDAVEKEIGGELIYVVVYDQFRNLFVTTELVKDNEDIWCCSRMPETITEETAVFRTRNFRRDGKNTPTIEIEIPALAPDSTDYYGSVKVGLSLEEMQSDIRQTRLVLILIGLGGFLLGLVGSGVLAKRITEPLKKLVEGTIRISRGDFSQTIAIASEDEIGNLARSFNAMTKDLLETRQRIEEANRRLIQAEKLASIGRISATIAHEIRNPLTSVKLNIQKVAENDRLGEEEKEHLGISQEGIGQIEKFIKELLNFTRVSDLNPERFSIVQIVEEAIKMLKGSFQEKQIVLERNYAENLPLVLVDGDKMRQVFLNILRNGVEAVEPGGQVSLSLSLVEEKGVKRIRARVSDNGCGIPEQDWENIFEPFFTTKPSGFGLGLANARKIVEQHKGSIRVVKKKGKGTVFEVRLPSEGEA
ncbi:MAG: ATP-binding protein [Acidobacteriota bacterium]